MDTTSEKFKGNEKGAAILYRYVGYYLALLLLKTPITPNILSTIGLGFGLLAAYLFSLADYPSLILATLFYQICIVIDYSDGTLARLTKRGSLLGQWLEATFDPVREFFIIFGLCWGLFNQSGDSHIWILGFILAGTNFIMDIQALTFEAFPFAKASVSSLRAKSIIYTIASHTISIRTTRYLLTIGFALFDQMYLYLVGFCCYNILVFLAMTFQLGAVIKKQDEQEG